MVSTFPVTTWDEGNWCIFLRWEVVASTKGWLEMWGPRIRRIHELISPRKIWSWTGLTCPQSQKIMEKHGLITWRISPSSLEATLVLSTEIWVWLEDPPYPGGYEEKERSYDAVVHILPCKLGPNQENMICRKPNNKPTICGWLKLHHVASIYRYWGCSIIGFTTTQPFSTELWKMWNQLGKWSSIFN